jgi:probable addiction module antidote protein
MGKGFAYPFILHRRPRLRLENDVFLIGLRDVVDAQGGMAHLAEATGLNRETLYRTLSENGNPRLSSLGLIIEALGLRLSIESPENDPRAA